MTNRAIKSAKTTGQSGTIDVIDPLPLFRQALEAGRRAAHDGAWLEAWRWLDRARRIAPEDGSVRLECAVVALRLGRPESADLFESVAEQCDIAEAWAGLAAAAQREGNTGKARGALATLLSCHAFRHEWRGFADAVAGATGWCGLVGDGSVLAPAGALLRVDGVPCSQHLPERWHFARRLDVMLAGRALLGSPIRPDRIARIDGYASRAGKGMAGWAWHPADPARDVALSLPCGTQLTLSSDMIDVALLSHWPLAKPRRFVLPKVGNIGLPGVWGRPEPSRFMGPPGQKPPPAALRRFEAPMRAADLLPDGSKDWLIVPPDVVLPPGLEETLRRAVYSSAVTGISCSLPDGPLGGTLRPVVVAQPPKGAAIYVRHDLLQAVPLRRATFWGAAAVLADMARRASLAGWRCVAVAGLSHSMPSQVPMDPGEAEALRVDAKRFDRIHPPVADRLAPLRRAATADRLASDPRPKVVLIGHALGGGTAQAVKLRADLLRKKGLQPLTLSPSPGGPVLADPDGGAVHDGAAGLRKLLTRLNPRWLEIHHLQGYSAALTRLPAALGRPYDIWLHDRGLFQARTLLQGARRLYAPSRDLAAMLRKCTGLVARVVPLDRVVPPGALAGPVRHVCVVGGIGRHKGADVLLGCALDAAARRLPLRFTVVGFTVCDEALLATGQVHITGPFAENEAIALIRAQEAQLGFVPSIETPDWRESWCFALSHLWAAGLPAAAFCLGAPAERIRAAGAAGGFLLPPGLSPSDINDALSAGMPVMAGRARL